MIDLLNHFLVWLGGTVTVVSIGVAAWDHLTFGRMPERKAKR